MYTAAPPVTLTRAAESAAWMGPDLMMRLVPFAAVVGSVWLSARPPWLGLSTGRLGVQLAFGLGGLVVLFVAASGLQLALARYRGGIRIPASGADLALQAGYYLLNAPIEEAFFRGLLQGGLTVLAGPFVGIAAATSLFVLYHRLGRWAWLDVAATTLVGVPMALAFWLLPSPASLLGISLAHVGATCGYIGPGPWLLSKLGLLGTSSSPHAGEVGGGY